MKLSLRSMLFIGILLYAVALVSPSHAASVTGTIDNTHRDQLMTSAQRWFEKGILFQEAGDARGAGDAFRRAIGELDSYLGGNEADLRNLSKAYVLRAKCRIFNGQSRQAIPDLDKALEFTPDDGDTFYLRSFAYRIMKDPVRSDEDLKTAARKGNEKARGELQAKGEKW